MWKLLRQMLEKKSSAKITHSNTAHFFQSLQNMQMYHLAKSCEGASDLRYRYGPRCGCLTLTDQWAGGHWAAGGVSGRGNHHTWWGYRLVYWTSLPTAVMCQWGIITCTLQLTAIIPTLSLQVVLPFVYTFIWKGMKKDFVNFIFVADTFFLN